MDRYEYVAPMMARSGVPVAVQIGWLVGIAGGNRGGRYDPTFNAYCGRPNINPEYVLRYMLGDPYERRYVAAAIRARRAKAKAEGDMAEWLRVFRNRNGPIRFSDFDKRGLPQQQHWDRR